MADLPNKVLYIEDHEESKLLVSRLLTAAGCEVITCSDGVRGLELALMLHPDLIIVDLSLPFMDGFETATRLKTGAYRSHNSVPIVASSVYAAPAEREMAIAAGCDGFIAKPIDVDTFIDEVIRYFNGKRDVIPPERERDALVRYHRRLVEKLDARAAAVLLDEETKTYNEAYLYRRLEEEASRFLRCGDSFSIVVLKLDVSGSDDQDDRLAVHRAVAELLQSIKRAFDVVARMGDDFCVLFGSCGEDNADGVARRICRHLLARLPSLLPKGITVRLAYGPLTYAGGKLVPETFVRQARDSARPFLPSAPSS